MTAVGIEIDHVSRRFELGGEEVWALRDVTIEIKPQEFLALIGRSGSGKTTLLNLIAGLDRPTNGTIRIDGRDLAVLSDHQLTELRRQQIGFIFQSFGLLPLLSAIENVELAMRIGGAGRRDRINRSRNVLEMMGLGKRAHHRPYELSGGEQQRVAIARAIANRPSLILADEPTGELDSSTAISIFKLLRDVAQSEGITIVTSTHDRTVMDLATRVEELADGRLRTGERRDLLAYVAERGGRRPVEVASPSPRQEMVASAVQSSAGVVVAPAVSQPPIAPAAPAHPPSNERIWAPPRPAEVAPSPAPTSAPVGDDSETDETSSLTDGVDEISRWAPPDRR